MSTLWKGNLLNSDLDIFVDSTLLLLIPLSYLAQLVHNNGDFSPYYLLFSACTANAQLSDALLLSAYAWPTASNAVLDLISRGELSGIRAYGAILGLLQNFLPVVMRFVRRTSLAQPSSNSFRLQAFALRGHIFVALLHAAAVVLPALASAYPPAPNSSFEHGIMLALINMSNLVVAPCFILLQLYAQRTSQGIKLPLLLQALVFALLAVRWWLRLGEWSYEVHPPPDLPLSERISLWWEMIRYFYTWGYPSINYALQFVVCVVLLCYRSAVVNTEETQPLLS